MNGSDDAPVLQQPARLTDSQGATAALLLQFRQITARDNQPLAWRPRPEGRRRAWRASLAFASAVAVGGVIVSFAARREPVRVGDVTQPAPLTVFAGTPHSVPASPPPAQGRPDIAKIIDHGVQIRTSADGLTDSQFESQRRMIVLRRGSVDIDVAPRPGSGPFVVRAGAYFFAMAASTFSLARRPDEIVLVVQAGEVRVSRWSRLVAVVPAGTTWTSARATVPREHDSKPTPLTVQPPPVGRDEPIKRCDEIARDESPQVTVAYFRELAVGDGLRAETALLAIGRLNAQTLHDVPGALAVLDEHDTRFPNGALGVEAGLARIELLAKAQDPLQAVPAIEAFLSRYPDSERVSELHFLLGHLLERKALNPCAAAAAFAEAADKAVRDTQASLSEAAALHHAKNLKRCLQSSP